MISMPMKIDFNLAWTIFLAVSPAAGAFFLFLHKMDKKISVMRNDIEWLKLKACQRRQEDFDNFIEKPG